LCNSLTRPYSTTPTTTPTPKPKPKPTSSRGCPGVGRLPRSAWHRNNFRKSHVSDVSATILARMSVSVSMSVSWNAGLATYWYRSSSVSVLSVCRSVGPLVTRVRSGKMADAIEIPFGGGGSGWPEVPSVRRRSKTPPVQGKDNSGENWSGVVQRIGRMRHRPFKNGRTDRPDRGDVCYLRIPYLLCLHSRERRKLCTDGCSTRF